MVATCARDSVRIIEVGPRDGLQNIKNTVPVSTKVELINRLYKSGLQAVELTSIVSPKLIPQLADFRKVLTNPTVKAVLSEGTLCSPVLVPNVKSLEVANAYGVKTVAVFVSASEGFSRANINCGVEEGLTRATAVAHRARGLGLNVRGYVSSIFACPFDGSTEPSAVFSCAKRLLDAGCYEVSLGDTIGVGVPLQTKELLQYLIAAGIPASKLAGHFHDTYGQAVANVWAAFECGIRAFDSSVSGLGGCPYAPGAEGNVATEDLVHLFQQANIPTGIQMDALVETGHWISNELSRPNGSRAGRAHAAKSKIGPTEGGSAPLTRSADWHLLSQCDPSDDVQIHQSGGNIILALNRPNKGNALTQRMIEQLTKFFEYAEGKHPEISRIVLAAKGKFFCTGMDISRDGSSVSKGASATEAQFQRLTRLFEMIERCRQTTIACIQGPAFGGGVGLAFVCDIRLASRNASMSLSEVRLGLCPATISKYIVREWGTAFVREAMLSGRAISAAELGRVGVIAVVTDNLASALETYLRQLKGCAPGAASMCKELVRVGWTDGGQEKQEASIRRVFERMMRPGSEASVGVEQLRLGKKQIDWDAMSVQARSRL